MTPASEAVIAAAVAAALAPLTEELVRYITGGTAELPDWVRSLPGPLRSRIAIEAAKQRQILGG